MHAKYQLASVKALVVHRYMISPCLLYLSTNKTLINYKKQSVKKMAKFQMLSFCQKSKSKMSSFKSNENIHKKEDGSYYVVSANKASSVTL